MNAPLVIISGPSGVGKGTLIKAAREALPNVYLGISATTRTKRAHEVDGKDYFFLSEDAFDKAIENDAFIEWCHVHKHRYGTLKSEYEKASKNHQLLIIEIDVQGANKIINNSSNALSIFITPPSLSELSHRLHNRNTESPAEITERIQVAKNELESKKHYTHVITNDSIKKASQNLIDILQYTLDKNEIEA